MSFHEKVECAKLGEKMRAWRKLLITAFIFGFVTVFVYEYSSDFYNLRKFLKYLKIIIEKKF